MEIICLDSTVVIDFYRKKQKRKSFLFKLSSSYQFYISAIVKYEIYRGDKEKDVFWINFFKNVRILPFDNECSIIAAKIYKDLKSKNQLISPDDILIAATALKNDFKLATINKKDFERIKGLKLITPKS